MLSVLLNICLAIDLILMIRHPFKPKEMRMPLYVWVSVALTIAYTLAYWQTLSFNAVLNGFLPSNLVLWSGALVFATFFIISFASIVYALKKLCRTGISKDSQKLVLVRHILSILGFCLAQTYLILCFFSMITPDWVLDMANRRLIKVLKVMFLTQGIYMPPLRLSEPFFFEVIKRNIKNAFLLVFCCRRQKVDEIEIDSLIDRELFDEDEQE